MSSGIEIRKAHFPGRAPLDAYGNGGFRFADMSHRGSLLCLPSGIYGWEHTIPIPNITDFARIFNEAKNIDILFIGTGVKRLQLAAETIEALCTYNIVFELMDTGAAARSFNILLSEERAVAAALTAVD